MVGRSWASDHRTPAGTAIMSPPHGATSTADQTRWRRQISTVGDRSARAPLMQPVPPRMAKLLPRSLAQRPTRSRRHPRPPAAVLRNASRIAAGQSARATCRHRFAALIALGNDLRLLLRSPSSPPAGFGKHLRPLNRFRLGFGRKLSVRHVSNPLNAAGSTFGVHHTQR